MWAEYGRALSKNNSRTFIFQKKKSYLFLRRWNSSKFQSKAPITRYLRADARSDVGGVTFSFLEKEIRISRRAPFLRRRIFLGLFAILGKECDPGGELLKLHKKVIM